jgi:autotransporter-associated beta strand protein
VTDVTNSDVIIKLDSLVFNPGAPQYTINALDNVELYGTGIENNSGTTQLLVAGAFFFFGSATAGDMVNFSAMGGDFFFEDASSAGSGTFALVTGPGAPTYMFFDDNSTAGDATINATGADIDFSDSATGGNATLSLTAAASVEFPGSGNAEHMTGTCIGGNQEVSSQIDFEGFSSAGEGTFTAIGGSVRGEHGGLILFDGISATADNATLVINGAMGAGLSRTYLLFTNTSNAGNANITASGGAAGAKGGLIAFQEGSAGGTAAITLHGNAELDVSRHKTGGVTIGSLSGHGKVFLGKRPLIIGSNNQSTTFAGVIQDGGLTGRTGGKLVKLGAGTLTLSGANTYTGGTTVSAGDLILQNETGSGTGPGSVQVNAGTLGGKGAISGPVTIGTGSGSGAFLAPSAAAKQPVALSLANTLTFNSDATYTCALQASKKKSANDEVVASGVTIASGAQFNLVAKVQGKLKAGASFTVISNTASTPISGTFANLADGAILTVGNAKLQASYEGGDGNDLTLTVVTGQDAAGR